MAVPSLRFEGFRDDWQLWLLGDLCNHVSYGLTVRPEYVEQGIPLISAREVVNGEVAIDKAPLISHSDFDKLSSKAKPQQGDVFLTKTGTIGLSALFKSDIIIAITQNIAVIRFDKPDEFMPEFFIQYLKTQQFLRKAISKVNQSTIMDLQLGDIKKLECHFPSLPEQRKIADFLSAVDEKIRLLTEKKEKLETYKKGVMQKLFPKQGQTNPELRFKRNDGTAFPDWEEKKVKEIFEIKAGGDISKENVSKVKSENYPYPIYANSEKAKGLYGWSDIYKIDYDSITVTGRGSLGLANARFSAFYPIVRLLVLRPKLKNMDLRFFESVLNQLRIYKCLNFTF